jgi:hypothetical protein
MTDPIWTKTGFLAKARGLHTATLLTNGKVLVTGGTNGEHAILASAEIYDPVTGAWTPTGALNVGRVDHTATLLPDRRVLVAGGRSQSGIIADAELYDPATGEWIPTGVLRDARGSHTATLLRSGLVLVAGGMDNNFSDRLASAELYDPATGKWSPTGSLTLDRGRESHTATLLDDGMVLVVGGRVFGPFMAHGAELYDPTSGTWIATAAPSAVRVEHTATLLRNGKVLVAGGVKSNAIGVELDSAELFDPITRTFGATGKLQIARNRQTATLLQSGRVLIAGGFRFIVDGDLKIPSTLRVAELYDPDTGQWTVSTEMNGVRAEHTATSLADGTVLVAGGRRQGVDGSVFVSVPLKNAELFDGG